MTMESADRPATKSRGSCYHSGMKRLRLQIAALGALCVAVAGPLTGAQDGKTLIRLVPKPNETFRFEATQHMEMDITADGMPQTSVPMLRKLVTDYIFGFTEKTGPLTEQGNVDAEVAYDRISLAQSIDGKPLPTLSMDKELEGKSITFTFDKEGKIIDVKLPAEALASGETLKEMMNSFFGSIPAGLMGIGETVTKPFSMPLPLPTPGPDPLTITGQTGYRLLAVAREGGETVARLDQIVEASLQRKLEIPLPEGKATVEIDFQVNGAGELLLSLDKGIMKSNRLQLTIKGTLVTTPDPANTPPQTLKLNGLSRMTSSGSY